MPSSPPADRTVVLTDGLTGYLRAAVRRVAADNLATETSAAAAMEAAWAGLTPAERDQAMLVSSLLLADYL